MSAMDWLNCEVCRGAMDCKVLVELAGAVWTGCCVSCHADETESDISLHETMLPCGHERAMCCEAREAIEKAQKERGER